MKLTQELINTLQGILDGKPWQFRTENSDHEWTDWIPEGCKSWAVHYAAHCHEIRLKPELEPEPDPYAEAKAAWRDGELQYLTDGNTWANWSSHHSPLWDGNPSYYRRKPKPVRVPLGPEDVPPGSVLRNKQLRNPWSAVLWVDRLDLGTSEHDYTWQHAAEELEINRSMPLTGKWDANAWEPCWKEVQP